MPQREPFTAEQHKLPALPGDSEQASNLSSPQVADQNSPAGLIQLVESTGLQLFHTPEGVGYAHLASNEQGRAGTFRIRSKPFRDWLARCYYSKFHQSPRPAVLQAIIEVLEGMALFEGREQQVHVRLAASAGQVYLDLGRPEATVVEVSAAGWRVIDNSPVRFRRPRHLLPLPLPERGGKVDELQSVLNIAAVDWCLVAAWLVAALNPHGPYPLLFVQGEQGTGKSLLAGMLHDLIDPCTGPLRAQPRELSDLMLGATNSWLLSFDNLSALPVWLSDGLCRLSTGGSFATRALYREEEEVVFHASRPVILTGLEDLAVRGDLLDRAVLLDLPPISSRQRRSAQQLWAQYEELHPRVLGALLDAASIALQRLPQLQLERLPRMADFAAWVVAASPGLGFAPETFLTTYERQQQSARELVLEGMPLVVALRQLLEQQPLWEGTASELHLRLASYLTPQEQRGQSWSATAQGLSNALRRLAPSLRSLGVQIYFYRTNQARLVRLEAGLPSYRSGTVS